MGNTFVSPQLNKISEVIDKDGNKLSGIKGEVIERKKEFNINEIEAQAPPTSPITESNIESNIESKIEQGINEKINAIVDKKIDEILNKML